MMAFWFIATVFLVLAGVIAAAGLIARKHPNARELIDRLLPYQGVIGLVLLLLSLINFIMLLVGIGRMRGAPAMSWMTWALYLAASVVGLGLGFLLSFGLINKILAASKQAGETPAPPAEGAAPAVEIAAAEIGTPAEPVGEALYIKLHAYQSLLGLAAIGLGLLSVIFGIIWLPPSATFMGVILFLLLLLTGGLAAAAIITRKMPEASGVIKCIESSKGGLGVATLVWGLLNLIWTLRLTGAVADWADLPKRFGGPGGGIWVWWVFSLLASLVAIALGFLLGFALLKRFVLSGHGEAAAAAEALRKKLAGIQVIVGLAGMLLGLLHLIFTLVWAS